MREFESIIQDREASGEWSIQEDSKEFGRDLARVRISDPEMHFMVFQGEAKAVSGFGKYKFQVSSGIPKVFISNKMLISSTHSKLHLDTSTFFPLGQCLNSSPVASPKWPTNIEIQKSFQNSLPIHRPTASKPSQKEFGVVPLFQMASSDIF